MKKLYTLATAMLLGACAMSAQEYDNGVLVQTPLGNPVLADGSYVVKYDMVNDCWAENNDFEIDETFVFALDLTGSEMLDKIAAFDSEDFCDRNDLADAWAGCAFCFRVTNSDIAHEGGEIDGRLIHIKDNIYGATMNIFQIAYGEGKDSQFGYLGKDENGARQWEGLQPGVELWLAGTAIYYCCGLDADGNVVGDGYNWYSYNYQPIQFSTAAYTGTKAWDNFSNADTWDYDVEEHWFFPNRPDDAGWGSPWCDLDAMAEDYATDGIASVTADSNSPVVATELYNIAGQRINNEPAAGLYIRKEIKADGTFTATKIAK